MMQFAPKIKFKPRLKYKALRTHQKKKWVPKHDELPVPGIEGPKSSLKIGMSSNGVVFEYVAKTEVFSKENQE